MTNRPELICVEEELIERLNNLLTVRRNETDILLRDEYTSQYNKMVNELKYIKRLIYGDKNFN